MLEQTPVTETEEAAVARNFKDIREKMKDPCWKGYRMLGTKKKGDAEVPNCVPVKEAKEKQEYDYEGDMARSQLRSIIANAQAVHDMLKPDTNMAEWVQSKITLAADYISTAADYMQSERNEVSEAAPAWTRKEGKSPSGGLNAKGIASYRRANPGSKLSMAVTTPPSKLDPDGKAAKRRKSFCARMGGSKGPMKDEKGEPTRKALALRKWNC